MKRRYHDRGEESALFSLSKFQHNKRIVGCDMNQRGEVRNFPIEKCPSDQIKASSLTINQNSQEFIGLQQMDQQNKRFKLSFLPSDLTNISQVQTQNRRENQDNRSQLSNTILSTQTQADSNFNNKEDNYLVFSPNIIVLSDDEILENLECHSQLDLQNLKDTTTFDQNKRPDFDFSDQDSYNNNECSYLSRRKDTLSADEIICQSPMRNLPQNQQQTSLGLLRYDSTQDTSQFLEVGDLLVLNNLNSTLTSTVMNEFLKDIIQHVQISDKPSTSQTTYELIVKNNGFLNLKERISISDWMCQFCHHHHLTRATFHLALAYFDKMIDSFTFQNIFEKSQQRLEGIAAMCLYISSKIEEPKPPRLLEFLQTVFRTNDLQQLKNIEREVLQQLNYELHLNTEYYWLRLILGFWAQFIENSESSSDDLECRENLFDKIAEKKLFYFLDVMKMDAKSSLYSPLKLALSLFYKFNILLHSNSSEDQSCSANMFEQKFVRLIEGINNGYNPIDLKEAMEYLSSYNEEISKVIRENKVTDEICDDSSKPEYLMCYSKYMRQEILSVILNIRQ